LVKPDYTLHLSETAKFYKALSYMGTDFSLILKVFPDRCRDDIKKKFSMEDRKNRMKVEDALRKFERKWLD